MADSSRTEHATPRKRNKVREEGRVARSRELPQALVFLGILAFLHFTSDGWMDRFEETMKGFMQLAARPQLDDAGAKALFYSSTDITISMLGPLLIVATLASLVGNFAGGGLIFAPAALRLKWDRLSPATGVQKLLPKTAGFELIKNLAYMTIVCWITWKAARELIPALPSFALVPPVHSFEALSGVVYKIALRVGILFGILAIADFFYQRYLFEESLKMTKQEVRDDYREVEGDPAIKGRIRRVQREMARRRMMAEVPKADVVITNPTHYAVAIAYKPAAMSAPTVVAKGQNYIAQKIRELAVEHEVPVVENAPLAQALYKSTDIGKPIPASLYKAIAELLAYLIKFKGLILRPEAKGVGRGR